MNAEENKTDALKSPRATEKGVDTVSAISIQLTFLFIEWAERQSFTFERNVPVEVWKAS